MIPQSLRKLIFRLTNDSTLSYPARIGTDSVWVVGVPYASRKRWGARVLKHPPVSLKRRVTAVEPPVLMGYRHRGQALTRFGPLRGMCMVEIAVLSGGLDNFEANEDVRHQRLAWLLGELGARYGAQTAFSSEEHTSELQSRGHLVGR